MNWLGALLVVTASYLCGVSLARDEGNRLKTLDSLISLLSYMRRRMSAERVPLYEIFAEFNDGFLEHNGFLDILRSHRHGIALLWHQAVSILPVDAEIKNELIRFGNSLGILPLDEQLKRLDALISFVSDKRSELRASLPDKQKSIKTICLLLGLMASIILL